MVSVETQNEVFWQSSPIFYVYQQLTINDNPLPKIALIVSQALNTASYSSKLVIF